MFTLKPAADLLQSILDEEEATNNILTEISVAKNVEALGDAFMEDAETE